MRDTGIIFRNLAGDTETAGGLTGLIRTQAGILKQQMAAGGLQTGAREVRLADGNVLRVVVAGGMTRAMIYSPSTAPAYEQFREAEYPTPQPHIPPVRLPVLHPIRIVVGLTGISAVSGLLPQVPAQYDGQLYEAAGQRYLWDASSRNGCPLWELPSDATSNGLYTALAVIGHEGVPVLADQPTSWTIQNADTGFTLASAVVFSAAEIAGLVGNTANMGAGMLQYPPSSQQCTLKLLAKGGAPLAPEGQMPTEGFIRVGTYGHMVLNTGGVGGTYVGGPVIGGSTTISYNGVVTTSPTNVDVTDGLDIVFSCQVATSDYEADPGLYTCTASITPSWYPEETLLTVIENADLTIGQLEPGLNTAATTGTFYDLAGNKVQLDVNLSLTITLVS